MNFYWAGPAPAQCDLCAAPITETFIDGKTIMGPWANMCSDCYEEKGVGLGSGKGQLYSKQEDGRWLKTKG